MATLQDVAREAGVSPMTVSRVFNRRSGVPVAGVTVQRVEDAARQLGYRPNQAARALATGSSHTLDLWASCAHTPYYTWVLAKLEEQAARHGYEIINTRRGNQPDGLYGGGYRPRLHLDGIFAVDCLEWVTSFLQGNGREPIVSLGNYFSRETDAVGVDLVPGVRAAMTHLLAQGCRRITYLCEENMPAHREPRHETYQEVMQEAGLTPEVITVPDQTRPTGYRVVSSYIQADGPPDALFCMNDDLAIAAFRALRDRGLRVPADVALVGCDGIEDAEYLDPRLSTIVQPVAEMCVQAWKFMERRLEEPTVPLQQAVLSARFVARDSSCRTGSNPREVV